MRTCRHTWACTHIYKHNTKTHTHTQTHMRTHTYPHAHSLSLSLSLSHTHTYIRILSLSPSLSLTHTHTQAHIHTHTHTHTYTRVRIHTNTHRPFISPSLLNTLRQTTPSSTPKVPPVCHTDKHTSFPRVCTRIVISVGQSVRPKPCLHVPSSSPT